MDKKKLWKILSNIIFYGLLVIFISISTVMLKVKATGNQPSIFGNKFYIVLTGSMSPTIKVGDLVVVKEVKPEHIKVNDVITFGSNSSDNITTHRVKEVLNDGQDIQYVTQGDANNVEDPIPVQSEVLLGRVNKVVPKVGTIILWIQKNILVVLIVLVALIIGSCVITKILKSNIGEDKKEEMEISKQ